MEKKSTVHPIFLTESQLALIKELIAPSVERDAVGNLALRSENQLTRNACQIQRQIEIAEYNDTQAIWLTRYDVYTEYDESDESSYYEYNMCWTEAYTCTAELVRNFNEQLINLYDEARYEADVSDAYLTARYAESCIVTAAAHTLQSIYEVSIPVDEDSMIKLAIEFTPGASVTMSKPIWE